MFATLHFTKDNMTHSYTFTNSVKFLYFINNHIRHPIFHQNHPNELLVEVVIRCLFHQNYLIMFPKNHAHLVILNNDTHNKLTRIWSQQTITTYHSCNAYNTHHPFMALQNTHGTTTYHTQPTPYTLHMKGLHCQFVTTICIPHKLAHHCNPFVCSTISNYVWSSPKCTNTQPTLLPIHGQS